MQMFKCTRLCKNLSLIVCTAISVFHPGLPTYIPSKAKRKPLPNWAPRTDASWPSAEFASGPVNQDDMCRVVYECL